MAGEKFTGEGAALMTLHLQGLGRGLIKYVPHRIEADAIVAELNDMFAPALGERVRVNSGQEYAKKKARLNSTESIDRETGVRYNTGIRGRGILQEFEVYSYADRLTGRGTSIEVFEPCLVYRKDLRSTMKALAPQLVIPELVYDAYVPIIRFGEIVLAHIE